MFKQFFKDSAIYGMANFLSQGISLLLLPFYTRVLTTTDYGITDILTVFASLINVTVSLEISQAVARHYADMQTNEEKIAYASTSLWFTIFAYTLFVVICGIFSAPLASVVLESSGHALVFQIALLFIWSNGVFSLTQNQLRWQLQTKDYALTSLTMTIIGIGASIFLILVLRLGVVGVMGGRLVGSIAGTAMAFFLARHSYRSVFDWDKLVTMLKFSVPLVPSSVGVIVSMYIDRIAISHLMTLSDVGLFGIGYRLASSVSIILMIGFQGALTPLIYKNYREPGTPADIARIFRYFVALALVIFLTLSLFSRNVLVLLTTPNYHGAAGVIPFLVLSILLSQMYIFAPGLSIAKKMTIFATINIVGGLLNTTLNFTLIPFLGIFGAGWANLISSGIVFTLYMLFSQRYYFVPHAWKQLGLATLLSIGVVIFATQIQLAFWEDILVKLALIGGIVIVFILLRLVERSHVWRIWQYMGRMIGFRVHSAN